MFWFDAHGGAGVWRKRVREARTRVARGEGGVGVGWSQKGRSLPNARLEDDLREGR